MTFQKVRPGALFHPSARMHNVTADMANAFQRGELTRPIEDLPQVFPHRMAVRGTVPIDVEIGDALVFDEAEFASPELLEFPVVKLEEHEANDTRVIAICADGALADDVIPAVFRGVVAADVDVRDPDHQFVELSDVGEDRRLRSTASSTSIRLLIPGEEDEDRSIILLTGGGGTTIQYARATTGAPKCEIFDPPINVDDEVYEDEIEENPSRRMRIYTFQAATYQQQPQPTEYFDPTTWSPSLGFTMNQSRPGMDPSGRIPAPKTDGNQNELPNIVTKESLTEVTVDNEDEFWDVEPGDYMTIIQGPDGRFRKLRWSPIL
ncbi:MAG: hypothetical protein AAF958_17625 [Planctomycetota bacterium]